MGVQTDPDMQQMLATELTDVTGQYIILEATSEGKLHKHDESSASKGMGKLDAKIECSDDGKLLLFNGVS